VAVALGHAVAVGVAVALVGPGVAPVAVLVDAVPADLAAARVDGRIGVVAVHPRRVTIVIGVGPTLVERRRRQDLDAHRRGRARGAVAVLGGDVEGEQTVDDGADLGGGPRLGQGDG